MRGEGGRGQSADAQRRDAGAPTSRAILLVLAVVAGIALYEVGQGFARPVLSDLSAWQDVVTLLCQAVGLVMAAVVLTRLGAGERLSDDVLGTCEEADRALGTRKVADSTLVARVCSVACVAAGVLAQVVIFATLPHGGLATAYMGSGLCGACFGACALAWVLVAMARFDPRRGCAVFLTGLAIGRLASMFVRGACPEALWLPIGFGCLDASIAAMVLLVMLAPRSRAGVRGAHGGEMPGGGVLPGDGVLAPRVISSWRGVVPVLMGAALFSLLFGFMTQVHNASRGFTTLPDYVSALITVSLLLALIARVVLGARPVGVGTIMLVGIPVLAGVLIAAPFVWDYFSDVADALVKSAFNLCYACVVVFLLQNAYVRMPRAAFAALSLAVVWTSVAVGSTAGMALSVVTGLDSPAITAFALGGVWIGMVVSTSLARIGGSVATDEAVARAVAQVRDEERARRPEPAVVYVDRTEEQVRRFAEEFGLTDREREVVLLFVRGRSAARIADDLTLSEHTVKTHLQNAYAKAGLHSRQELLDKVGAVEVEGLGA